MSRTLTLTATMEHKERADKALEDSNALSSRSCLVVQVIKDTFPNVDIGVGYVEATVGEDVWVLDSVGRQLVQDYDNVRKITFPQTFTITLRNQDEENS